MRRIVIVLLIIIIVPSIAMSQTRRRLTSPVATTTESTPQPAGAPLTGLTAQELAAFQAGRAAFNRNATPGTGLGPVFNESSCLQCHTAPASGGGSANQNVTRFGRLVNGVFDPMTSAGGSLRQDRAIGNRNGAAHTFLPENVPNTATIVAQRRTTPLFGLGLVDATPDSVFLQLAAEQSSRGDGVIGRVNLTDNIRAGTKTVGRFGWKAQVPTLFQFAGDALVNEMGITTPDFPNETCPQGNCAELAFNPAPGLNDSGITPDAMTSFMKMLAAPVRGPQNADTAAGEQLFASIGCATCHVPTLSTGSSTIAALDHKTYHPYSDFLLHDMGALGDGLEMSAAKGGEIRTAPLWGLRFINRYLHDGRATTLEQAIAAHSGQGTASRNTFTGLPLASRTRVLAFLRSL